MTQLHSQNASGSMEPSDWIDAHCHLADPRFSESIDKVLSRSRASGVTRWIQGGVGPADWQKQGELRERYGDSVLLSFGLHPWWVASHDDTEVAHALNALPDALANTVALGELGLDYHPKRAPSNEHRKRQAKVFSAQLAIAKTKNQPVILHVVRAHQDTLNILADIDHQLGGLVHSFSGTLEQGQAYIARGFLLSLSGGGLTSPKRRRLYAELPRDRIVIETDAPDQLPRDWPGELNEPSRLPDIATAWAETWGCSGTELLNTARDQLEKLFGLRIPLARGVRRFPREE